VLLFFHGDILCALAGMSFTLAARSSLGRMLAVSMSEWVQSIVVKYPRGKSKTWASF